MMAGLRFANQWSAGAFEPLFEIKPGFDRLDGSSGAGNGPMDAEKIASPADRFVALILETLSR
jgi:hypothetical protein